MSMISEQIRRLREFAKTLTYADEYNLIKGAADSIEELSGKLHKSQMERSSQYYHGGWIPVTERLPDKLQYVLVAFDDAPGEYDVAYLRKTFKATYKANGAENEWVSVMGETTYADYEVNAWMPIPTYNGGDKDAVSD